MLSISMFSMSTCQPCKGMKKILDELIQVYDEDELDVSYVVVDKDENGADLATEWGIHSVPTLIFIKDREEQSRQVGAVSRETMERYIAGFVGKKDGEKADACGLRIETA